MMHWTEDRMGTCEQLLQQLENDRWVKIQQLKNEGLQSKKESRVGK